MVRNRIPAKLYQMTISLGFNAVMNKKEKLLVMLQEVAIVRLEEGVLASA
jgi:hypothetical protein